MDSRRMAIQLLTQRPETYSHAIGFDKLTKLHSQWIRSIVLGKQDKTLLAHRGSYKTTCVSIGMAIILLLYPNYKTCFIRKTDRDVKEVIEQTRKILQHPISRELARTIWGVTVELKKSTASEISTNLTNDPRGISQLVGIGLGSSITGKHFDRIFTDDIVNIEDRVSKSEREHTKIMYQELQNIRNRGGRIFNSGTPWHKEDCFSIMPTPARYDCYSTGLISGKELAELRDSMLPSLFAANYELRHIAAENIIFKDPQTGAGPEMVQQAKWCHIDAAYGGEDGTAFTICRKVDGKYYVLGKLWQKHVDDCLDEIISIRKQYNAGRISCEENADKGYLAKDLRLRGERVVPYWEDENKFIKIASYLRKEWKNIVFVKGTDEEYIKQICDYNEDVEHDDAPDSLASIVRVLWGKKSDNQQYVPLYMR